MIIQVTTEDIKATRSGATRPGADGADSNGNPISRALRRATGRKWYVLDGSWAHELQPPYRSVALPDTVLEHWMHYQESGVLQSFDFEANLPGGAAGSQDARERRLGGDRRWVTRRWMERRWIERREGQPPTESNDHAPPHPGPPQAAFASDSPTSDSPTGRRQNVTNANGGSSAEQRRQDRRGRPGGDRRSGERRHAERRGTETTVTAVMSDE